MHELQDSPVFDLLGHPIQQSLMVDPVKELGQVNVDRPGVSVG
jgi:hypothetical protein